MDSFFSKYLYVFNLSFTFGKISTHDLRSTIENSTLFQPPAEKSSTRNIRKSQVSLGQVIIVGGKYVSLRANDHS